LKKKRSLNATKIILSSLSEMTRFELLRYDPRITPLDGKFYITYAAHGTMGVRVSMIETEDFINFKRIGYISQPDNRNGVLLPEKVNGLYVRFDRPTMAHGQGGKGLRSIRPTNHGARSRWKRRYVD